jgi:hypothetical protein
MEGNSQQARPLMDAACTNGRLCSKKAKSAIYAGWRIAKSFCFIERIGDTFAQC